MPRSPSDPSRRHGVGNVIAVVLVALVAALTWYLTHRPGQPAQTGNGPRAGVAASGSRGNGAGGAPGRGGPPSTVGIATARHADIPVILEALGTVTSAATVTVTPQVSGVITAVLYQEGQAVKKGQVLATIDAKPFQNALDQAVGARMRDSAQLDAARVLLAKYQTLLKQDSIAGQSVDTQAALVQQLAGTVALDKANEEAARLNLQWTRIVAPVAGRVGLRPVDPGNFMAAGNASGVATITQVAPIDVLFSIPQQRVPELQQRRARHAALPVTVWDSSRTRQLDQGSFSTLDNQIDTTTGTVRAKARLANAAGVLFPNQFVNVRLLLDTVDAAVVVPATALRHGPNGDFVYVVGADHTVALRPVTAGLSGVDDVAIAQGLEVGEQVVTEGGDRLKDGSRIVAAAAAADRPASAASRSGRGGHRQGAAASGAALAASASASEAASSPQRRKPLPSRP